MQRSLLVGCLIFLFISDGKFQMIKYNNEMVTMFSKAASEKIRPQTNVTILYISLHIEDLYDISEQKMTFKMKYYFRLYWLETGLKFNPSETLIRMSENDTWIKVNYSNPDHSQKGVADISTPLDLDMELLSKKIWFPDIYIVNQVPTEFDHLNYEKGFAKLSPDGHIFFFKIVTSSMICKMNLRKFPFDTQYCSVIFESFSYKPAKLAIQWKMDSPQGAVSSDKITLDDFDISGKLDARGMKYSKLIPLKNTSLFFLRMMYGTGVTIGSINT